MNEIKKNSANSTILYELKQAHSRLLNRIETDPEIHFLLGMAILREKETREKLFRGNIVHMENSDEYARKDIRMKMCRESQDEIDNIQLPENLNFEIDGPNIEERKIVVKIPPQSETYKADKINIGLEEEKEDEMMNEQFDEGAHEEIIDMDQQAEAEEGIGIKYSPDAVEDKFSKIIDIRELRSIFEKKIAKKYKNTKPIRFLFGRQLYALYLTNMRAIKRNSENEEAASPPRFHLNDFDFEQLELLGAEWGLQLQKRGQHLLFFKPAKPSAAEGKSASRILRHTTMGLLLMDNGDHVQVDECEFLATDGSYRPNAKPTDRWYKGSASGKKFLRCLYKKMAQCFKDEAAK